MCPLQVPRQQGTIKHSRTKVCLVFFAGYEWLLSRVQPEALQGNGCSWCSQGHRYHHGLSWGSGSPGKEKLLSIFHTQKGAKPSEVPLLCHQLRAWGASQRSSSYLYFVSAWLCCSGQAAFPRLPAGAGKSMLQLLAVGEALRKLFIQLQRVRGAGRKGSWACLWGSSRGKNPQFGEVGTVWCHSHSALPSWAIPHWCGTAELPSCTFHGQYLCPGHLVWG